MKITEIEIVPLYGSVSIRSPRFVFRFVTPVPFELAEGESMKHPRPLPLRLLKVKRPSGVSFRRWETPDDDHECRRMVFKYGPDACHVILDDEGEYATSDLDYALGVFVWALAHALQAHIPEPDRDTSFEESVIVQ